jgi:signal transduction histidine kinase
MRVCARALAKHLQLQERLMAIDKPGSAEQHADDKLNLHLVFDEGSSVSHLEEHIERLNRLASLGTLAASMAHEIKNALVAGKTFIDLLLENNQDAELAQVVRRELGRIDGMVSRILRFARPGEFRSRKVHLHEILEHSLRLVEPLMETKPVSVTKSLMAVEDVVDGDEHELQQAFVNLLLNAVDAVGPNGKITVATRLAAAGPDPQCASTAKLHITIHDTGTGIAPEHMKRLFEPFFTTKPSGTGLGLAITRRILLQHRGEISAQSPPGEGTTFTILLPATSDVGH